MLDGNNERPPNVQEIYAGTVSNGGGRVGDDHTVRTPGDVVAAGGMNQYRMGMALMRLVSEWNAGAVPRQVEVPDAKALARAAARARVESGIAASEEEYGGMRVSDKRARLEAAPVTKHEVEYAQAEHRQLAAMSTDWSIHEHRLRFQRLKTLPKVRAELVRWVKERDWEDAESLVAGVLQYFLSPKCPACGGSGVREFAGNNRRGAGKPCSACRARKNSGQIKAMGEMPLPGHGRGRALLAYMLQCTGQAAKDLREGAHRLRRSAASQKTRAEHKHHEQIAKLRRADEETRVDDAQDREAVAAHFREGMGRQRRKE